MAKPKENLISISVRTAKELARLENAMAWAKGEKQPDLLLGALSKERLANFIQVLLGRRNSVRTMDEIIKGATPYPFKPYCYARAMNITINQMENMVFGATHDIATKEVCELPENAPEKEWLQDRHIEKVAMQLGNIAKNEAMTFIGNSDERRARFMVAASQHVNGKMPFARFDRSNQTIALAKFYESLVKATARREMYWQRKLIERKQGKTIDGEPLWPQKIEVEQVEDETMDW